MRGLYGAILRGHGFDLGIGFVDGILIKEPLGCLEGALILAHMSQGLIGAW